MRSEQGLFREVVKHLNQVEEQVLESLAWTGGSPLWESLHGAKDHVPTCQEVSRYKDTLYSLINIINTYPLHDVHLSEYTFSIV